jgi:TRAP-type C4-dicarboxylate transport system permease small subunit
MPVGRKLVVEFIGKFFLVFTVCTAVAGRMLIRGKITGIFGALKWSHIWIYLLATPLGGAAAAVAFLYVQPAEKPEGDIEAARVSE